MSESIPDKWQKKFDRKLLKMTNCWQKNVRIDSNWFNVTKIWQFSVNFVSFITSCSDMFCQFDHCFLVVITLVIDPSSKESRALSSRIMSEQYPKFKSVFSFRRKTHVVPNFICPNCHKHGKGLAQLPTNNVMWALCLPSVIWGEWEIQIGDVHPFC